MGTNYQIRNPNMKPPETVTLIDLEGKQWREFFSDNVQDEAKNILWAICAESFVISNDANLLVFIVKQLVFITEGMWETLAIYQATLGRYWEVPVMEYEQATVDYLNRHNICHIVRRIETKIYIPCKINNEDISVEQILKTTEDDRCILVTPSVYLEHYPDVFSRLRPWKGESTQAIASAQCPWLKAEGFEFVKGVV
jgi:hypothetical protein